ncbi:Neuroligin-4, X-linked [Folsomia candida]|uniref:Neuroligin-4, X-linked n=1 Tax=Folsomia candida TaxID=158441 RepID=A0A226DL82_FOLCA|nr:Neuroligin-4, X-linked [Folsomia candida]
MKTFIYHCRNGFNGKKLTPIAKSSEHPIATRDLTVNALTDCLSLAPVIAIPDSGQVNRGFFYIFEHATKDSNYNYFSSQGQRTGGVGGEELSYMFGTPLVDALTGHVLPFIPPPAITNYTKAEMALSELFITYLSNFAHSGDPNEPLKGEITWPVSKERNRYKSSPWEGYDRLHQKYLEISVNKVRTRSHYRAHQMSIWLRLVPELQRSGAQSASGLHNRMKGGNDPSLYVGKLRHQLEGDDPLTILDIMGYRGFGLDGLLDSGGGVQEESSLNLSANPPAPPTTCFSPLAASSSPSLGGKGTGGEGNNSSTTRREPVGSSFFAPYSTALSVTIAIGCSLLILNVFIFALVYYHRDKKRVSSVAKSGSQNSQLQNCSKYGEPPELLKSNSMTTTCSTVSHCHGGMSPISSSTNSGGDGGFKHYHQNQAQLAQEALAQRGILLSPSQAGQQYGSRDYLGYNGGGGGTMGMATLQRNSNGGIGGVPKPPPPPRSCVGSTLQHSNSVSFSSNYDELKV